MNRKTEQLIEWAPLQHWRVVRYWACRNNDLQQADLELLLYLEPIGWFTIDDFRDGTLVVTWDKNRFYRLQKEEWIKKVFNGRGRAGGHNKYVVSSKGKRLIKRLYRILSGEELIPESIQSNNIMKRESYVDKMYSQAISKFNKHEHS